MASHASLDSPTLRVFGGIMIVIALLLVAGAFLGYYTIFRNADDSCQGGSPPDGVDGSRESPVTAAGAVLVPVALSCSFQMEDGSTLQVLRPDWVTTGFSALGI